MKSQQFELVWLSGVVEVIEGEDLSDALLKSGNLRPNIMKELNHFRRVRKIKKETQKVVSVN